jgi:nucleotide-binding universal stress UspA family protein
MWPHTHLGLWRRPAQLGAARRDFGDIAQASPRPVVVGVTGSAASTRALEWATVRAFAGHTSLHIVNVVHKRLWFDPGALIASWYIEPREIAEQVLYEAIRCARYHAPQLQISTRLCYTDPAAALLDEGRTAELIVLGHSRRRRLAGWLDRSVTRRVSRRARGRVVIVSLDDEVQRKGP